MTGPENEFLRELEVEVEDDIQLDASAVPPEEESPAEWLLDPYEAQVESADLNSLHGAIEALEPYRHSDD
ncbi:hypothetical protein [Kribbella sp. NPDC004536]|uniref:hypothetical protein n=1 Tax=Kribbella sp. NPDC004536 TaxID=3364106 RepID=UPI003691B0D2